MRFVGGRPGSIRFPPIRAWVVVGGVDLHEDGDDVSGIQTTERDVLKLEIYLCEGALRDFCSIVVVE